MNQLFDLSFPFIKYWVSLGAISGALISGSHKLSTVCDELSHIKPNYKFPLIERPITAVYHTSRIAYHTGLGAGIAGLAALTAPISLPIYVYYKNTHEKQEK